MKGSITKNMLHQAFKVGANELAEKIMTDVYEQAKYHPDIYVFKDKLNAHEYVLDEVLGILKHNLLGIKVSITLIEDGLAAVEIDWSY